MDIRFSRIVDYLYRNKQADSNQLALNFDVNVKTIKKVIEDNINECDKYGFILEKDNNDYKLKVLDQELLSKYLKTQSSKLSESDYRINYLIKRLLENEDYLKIEDLADELYVSRATIDRLMPELKEKLEHYSLSLNVKPKYGIKLEGSETNKRIIYAHLKLDETLDSDGELFQRVQSIINKQLKENDLILDENNTYNLIQHCTIAIKRIHKGNVIVEEENLDSIEEDVLKCTNAIADNFQESFDIEIPLAERKYIAIHLLGKQIIKTTNMIDDKTIDVCDRILKEIEDKTKYNLKDDSELRTLLLLHIQPLLIRMKYGLKQDNPLITGIKSELNEGYELATMAGKILKEESGDNISEDELGYLALHFQVALDRLKENEKNKRKIVLVCASGRGTAKLLQYRLVNKSHINPDNIILTSSLALDSIDLSDVACILTMIPLDKNYEIPTILIDMNLGDYEISQINDLLYGKEDIKEKDLIREECVVRLDCKNKEEVLTYLADKVNKYDGVQKDFLQQLQQREELSSTEVGNSIAMPHPYNYEGDKLIIVFALLEKPIKWKFNDVELIIMQAYPKEIDRQQEEISNKLITFITDKNKVKKLINDYSVETVNGVVFN